MIDKGPIGQVGASVDRHVYSQRSLRGLPGEYVDSLISAVKGGSSANAFIAENGGSGLAMSPAAARPNLGTVSIAFEVFGVRIGLLLTDPNLLGPILQRLPPGWKPLSSTKVDVHYRIDRNPETPHEYEFTIETIESGSIGPGVGDAEEITDALERALEGFLAEHAYPWLFLHAGVVGWQGQAIILPGRSYCGKSTLVAALVAAGATYYSDEYAVLDVEGRVFPYPRRLSLRRQIDGGRWRNDRVEMPQVGGLGPLKVGLVALMSYDADLPRKAERLDQGAAMMALCAQTVAIRRRPADAFSILERVVHSAQVVRGFRGEARDAAKWLLSSVWR